MHQLPCKWKHDFTKTEIIDRAEERPLHVESICFTTTLQLIARLVREGDGNDTLVAMQPRNEAPNLA